MRTASILLAVAVGVGVAGCQVPHKGHLPPPTASTQMCTAASCDLKVTVDSSCVVSVDPEVLNLSRAEGNQKLNWKLESSGFKFSDDPLRYGIFIKDPPNTNGQFHNPSHAATQITLQFKHKTPGTVHTYGINVVRSNGETCSTKDPWVVE